MLLHQLHHEAASWLQSAGITDPRREIALLLAHHLDMPLAQVYARPDQLVDDAKTEMIRQAARRRSQHEPLAYLLGETDFSGLTFVVGPGVLVPRPDSEILVETAFTATESLPANPLLILDACAGSGCIGISLAVRLRLAGRPVRLWLTDLDPVAAGYARGNLSRHRLEEISTLVIADLWPDGQDLRWDLIVANPPYIGQGVIPGLMPEVRVHEPLAALDGGPGGLRLLRRLITEAAGRLSTGGCLLLEHGYDQADAVAAMIQTSGRYVPIPAIRDFGGQPRVSGGWLK